MKNLAVVPSSSSSSSSSSAVLSSCVRQPKTHQVPAFLCPVSSIVGNPRARLCSSNAELQFGGLRLNAEAKRRSFRCNFSSNRPGNGGSGGDNESRSVLDAFFLGKALAEVINERIESTVGEVLSSLGRFQAEQQKQVQEIQEEVLERAKRAKERAAREAMEAQGLVSPKPTTINQAPAAAASSGISSVTPYSNSADTASPSSSSGTVSDSAKE